MGRFQKLQAPELPVGDIAADQLHLQSIGMMTGPEQHRLIAEALPGLAVVEHGFHGVQRLALIVFQRDKTRARPLTTGRHQVFVIAAAGLGDDGVGRIQYRLGGAIVLFQRHDARRWVELLGEVEDVFNAGRAEAVNRLGIVPHDGQAGPIGA